MADRKILHIRKLLITFTAMLLTYLDDEKIDASDDMISMYDREMTVLKWNPACERIWGIPASIAISKKLEDLFRDIDIKNDYRYDCLVQAATQGKSFYFPDLPYRYRNGNYYQAIVRVKTAPDRVIGVLNIVRDSTQVTTRITKRDLLVSVIKTAPENVAHLFK